MAFPKPAPRPTRLLRAACELRAWELQWLPPISGGWLRLALWLCPSVPVSDAQTRPSTLCWLQAGDPDHVPPRQPSPETLTAGRKAAPGSQGRTEPPQAGSTASAPRPLPTTQAGPWTGWGWGALCLEPSPAPEASV